MRRMSGRSSARVESQSTFQRHFGPQETDHKVTQQLATNRAEHSPSQFSLVIYQRILTYQTPSPVDDPWSVSDTTCTLEYVTGV